MSGLGAFKVVVDSNRSTFEQEADNLQIAQEHLESNGLMKDA